MYCSYIRECPCSSELSTKIYRDKGHDSANNSNGSGKVSCGVCVSKEREIRYGNMITVSEAG